MKINCCDSDGVFRYKLAGTDFVYCAAVWVRENDDDYEKINTMKSLK